MVKAEGREENCVDSQNSGFADEKINTKLRQKGERDQKRKRLTRGMKAVGKKKDLGDRK